MQYSTLYYLAFHCSAGAWDGLEELEMVCVFASMCCACNGNFCVCVALPALGTLFAFAGAVNLMGGDARLNLLLTHEAHKPFAGQAWYQTLTQLLAPMGVRTFEATSGQQAVDLIAGEANPISPAQSQAREQLWTPERAEGRQPSAAGAGGRLWTPTDPGSAS